MKKYEILGGNLPVVVCELSAGESMITESGSMPEHENGDDFRRRNEENVRQTDVWRFCVSKQIYRRRCRRNDCICIKFSGSDQSIGD